MDSQLAAAAARLRQEDEAQAKRFEEASRRRLARLLEKKLRTAFIGALAAFETHFGDLWSHGLDEFELTQEQREWRERWNSARLDVLNNGNNQLRAVQQELLQYLIKWNGHELKLPVLPGGTQK